MQKCINQTVKIGWSSKGRSLICKKIRQAASHMYGYNEGRLAAFWFLQVEACRTVTGGRGVLLVSGSETSSALIRHQGGISYKHFTGCRRLNLVLKDNGEVKKEWWWFSFSKREYLGKKKKKHNTQKYFAGKRAATPIGVVVNVRRNHTRQCSSSFEDKAYCSSDFTSMPLAKTMADWIEAWQTIEHLQRGTATQLT